MARWSIERRPAYSVLKVSLSPGESITVEPGSYMMNRGDVEVKTGTGGGILRGLTRAILAGESIFLNTLIARGPAEVWIAPNVAGDIVAAELRGADLMIQDTSYLAHIGNIDISVGWRGLKGLIAEGELVWIKARGAGTVFLNGYGAIEEIELSPGEKVTIDNTHFVALEATTSWGIRKFGGWKSAILGGEGFVVDVKGPGRIWVQTRSLPAFASVLSKFLPSE